MVRMECGQHTGGLGVFLTCKLSRALELILVLRPLGEIGVALAQSWAHAWLRFCRYHKPTNILLRRNSSPERERGKCNDCG